MTGPRRRIWLILAALVTVALVGVASAFWLLPAPLDPLRGPPVAAEATTRPVEPVPTTRPAGVTEPPPGTGFERYTEQALSWRPCRVALQCATVLAPLDYDVPDGPAVTLVMARLGDGRGRLGSLFLNPGGPGGSGLELLAAFDRTGLEPYDLVSWDPRGVGESTPVTCFDGRELEAYVTVDASPDDPAERDRLLRGQAAFNRSCLAASGVLLPHVSTAATVRDLDLLRILLDQPKLNYLGFSYGTQIGATYADRFGSRVGRMVLDGAVDLSEASVPQAQGFERALRGFASWCVRQRCPLGADAAAVVATVTDLWRRLDEAPLPVGGRELNQTLALSGVLTLLYEDERNWPILVEALDAAVARQDGRRLLRLADLLNRRGDDGRYGQLTYAYPAIRCLDSDVVSLAEVEREAVQQRAAAPVLGPFFGPDVACALWPLPPVPGSGRITGSQAPPLLVVGSTGDPATPYEWAQGMDRQLESAVLVTRRGFGHTAYSRSSCIRTVVQRFLAGGQTPQTGTTCP